MKQALFLSLMLSFVLLGGCLSSPDETTPMIHDGMEVSAEHCAMMPEMPGCDKYISGSTQHDMMDHGMMIRSEFDFISLMIPHHEEAIWTSKYINQYTKNTELQKLTKAIVQTQTKEVVMMQGWLSTWYSGQQYKGMPYMPMMRSQLIVRGAIMNDEVILEIEKIWLEDMIVHHEGAVAMAKKLLQIMDSGSSDAFDKPMSPNMTAYKKALREFANAIITTQGQEIEQMKAMLQATS